MKNLKIFFATSNPHKFNETREILAVHAPTLELVHFPFEHCEIRSDSLEEVAREALGAAFEKCVAPVFVEDTGLFIDSLNGFPGTFSAWVLKKLSINGILKLMSRQKLRNAYFETCIAYADGGDISIFKGTCSGSIAKCPRGKGGFGYDRIFIPEGADVTFAQSIELKNKLSHRYKTLLEFCNYLTQ